MKFSKMVASVLLLFNGLAALYGGLILVVSPGGRDLGLSLALLKDTPFDSFLIPGIVLFISNGLASVFVLSAILSQNKQWAGWVVLQGCILITWILVQMALIRTANMLHAVLGTVGVLLIVIGYLESPAVRRKEALKQRRERRLQEVEQ
jgi:hypothetical protein